MKKLLKTTLLLTALSASALTASTIKIGTGSQTGNYYSMANDITSENYCKEISPDASFEVLTSEGSGANLDGLLNKKYSIGIIQSDVLMSNAKKSPRKVNMNRMKILAGLHIETAHLLIPNGYQPKQTKKSGNIFSSFMDKFSTSDNKPVKISLQSLKNQQIASWGGSVTSARALSYFFDLNWEIKEVPKDNRENINKMPILLVGGQPYAPVEKYLATGNYKLVGLDYKEISNKAPFYMSSEATYNINGKSYSVPSIGIQALMIGKSFRKASRNENMQKLAQCINESLPDLADDPDTNPNWNSVYELNEKGEQLNWSYFPIK
ncbi:MAG: TAXI family TRAP transporter solute-binding subunit [Campylobacterota bacterium]|nr:TAXI family TRAP transporter solute-binding subunit [Campylobacterota bacterium]